MKEAIGVFLLLAVAAAGTAGLISKRSGQAASPRIKIAVPDDTGGLVVHYLLREEKFRSMEMLRHVGSIQVRDCCAAVFESSMASSTVDAAVMCPDAATELISRDPRFQILGPCVLSSEVVVLRPGTTPGKIGVSQRRKHQQKYLLTLFGPGCAAEPMIPAALRYAYERNAVDGVLIDALKAKEMSGERIHVGHGRDLTTYVLVIAKSIKSSALFAQFMEAWGKALIELRDPGVLGREVEAYSGLKWTDQELDEWKGSGVKLVFPAHRVD